MVFHKETIGSAPSTGEALPDFLSAPEVTPNEDAASPRSVPTKPDIFSQDLRAAKRGQHSNYVAKTLSGFAGWSYSDFGTFKDVMADRVGPGTESVMIQIKNEPLLVQATAQLIRTSDKKVAIVAFRGTEMMNLVNWMTDAAAKKSTFFNVKRNPDCPTTCKQIEVHSGFKNNFEKVWFGRKGILMHLLNPEMMRKDYDYDKTGAEQGIASELDQLEAIYICGHSLGGAMAFLAGLYLGAMAEKKGPNPLRHLFEKLRGVYTYGAPMAIDDHDRARCQQLCGKVTFRHVYYNDIVPHLPPLSMGGFDHVGPEYRFHPRDGWKKRPTGGFGFKNGRATQVLSVAATAPLGALDGVLDNINWLNFWRGDEYDWPIIGFLSRGYLKMPWSLLDHSPVGYISSLDKLPYGGSLDKDEE